MTLAEGNLKIPKCQACRETGLEIQITLLLGFIICDFFECYSMNKQWNFKIRTFDSTTSVAHVEESKLRLSNDVSFIPFEL